MAISWEIPLACTNPQEIHNKHQETMTYKILWYKKAVYHISYGIVFVIFWFTRNWTTQTQDHMNFGKSIPMVFDFATSLALYISLSCWGTPFCFELQKKMHAHQWEPLKTGYQMLPVPRTSRNHAIGFTATTFALAGRRHQGVKTRLWFGVQIPALNLMAGGFIWHVRVTWSRECH